MVGGRIATLGVVLMTACSGADAPVVEQAEPALEQAAALMALPDLTGIVRELTPEGWIVVEAAGLSAARRVRVGYETNLQLGGGVAGHWGDLAVGRRVSVWLRGDSPDEPARMVMIEDAPDG